MPVKYTYTASTFVISLLDIAGSSYFAAFAEQSVYLFNYMNAANQKFEFNKIFSHTVVG
jgi:hypothetical protein